MLKLHKNIDLKPFNTFGIQAKADHFVEFTESVSLRAFLADPPIYFKDLFILGGGSNILFKDDYKGCIIHPANKGIRIVVEDSESVLVEVQAGEEWDVFVQWAVSHNLGGVENLAYIPGRVGACPVQNIGAYGSEVKDSIVSVEIINIESAEVTHLSNPECQFGYRDSIFKNELKDQQIILSVLFKLTKKPEFKTDYKQVSATLEKFNVINLATINKAIREIRQSKLPEPWELGNAGSFFKNPIVKTAVANKLKEEYDDIPIYPIDDDTAKLAAGWLIDKAGWKGEREGDVGVHTQQALVLVNYGKATGTEIIEFADKIGQSVKKKFGVELQPEVIIV